MTEAQRTFPALAFAALFIATLAVACSKPAETGAVKPEGAPGEIASSEKPVATASLTQSTTKPSDEPPAPPLEKPLEVGSQDVRDDFYCSGLLFAEYPTPMEAQPPAIEARIMQGQMHAISLGEAAAQKLVAEGAAVSSQTLAVADAWAEVAAKDHRSGQLQVSLDACVERAEALPVVE